MGNRVVAKSSNLLVNLIGIFLLIFSLMSIYQGIYALRISFREGRFGFEYNMSEDGKSMVITGLVEDFPAALAGLKPGDRILYVNEKAVGEVDFNTVWANAAAGTRVSLTIQRGKRTMNLRITRKLLPLIDRLIRVLYHLVFPILMLFYILVGFWGIFKQPSFITNLIALVCFFFGAMIETTHGNISIVTSPLTKYFYYYYLREILAPISMSLAPAFWLYLFVNFPRKTDFYKKHKHLAIILIFLFPLTLLGVILAAPHIYYDFKLLPLFYALFMGGYIFAGIAVLSRDSKKEKNVLKKRQYQLILFGIKTGALAISLGFCCLLVYSLFMKSWAPYFGWLTLFLFLVTQVTGLILPFTFLNSFFHNKILETESALRRKLHYIAATAFLFFVYLTTAFFLSYWIISRFRLTDPSFIVLVVLVLSLTFSPLNSWVLRWLEQKLYPEKTKYKSALRELIKRMSTFIEESQILENLSHWISETMGISPIYAVSIDNVGGKTANVPLKVHSNRSVLAKVKDGSSFFWDEISDEAGNAIDIDEDEKKWALNKGISITVPMISRGEQVGVLSIGKKKNKEDFTGDDLEIFQEAAYHTAVALQNIKLQMEHLEKKRIDKELEVARNIQEHLMPRKIPRVKGLQIHGEYEPCFEVGGDYFDIISIDENKTALVIADVSGKGAGAALLMSNLQASLKMAISVSLPLREILFKINNMIVENSPPSQFITFFMGLWDNEAKTLSYINAGHNPPLVLRKNNKIRKLSPTGIGLGIKENQVYKCKTLKVSVDDVLVIYTDGIEEYFNYQLEAFGIDRMIQSFKESKHLHPREIIHHLFDRLRDFAMGKPAYHCDDLTIIAAKRVD